MMRFGVAAILALAAVGAGTAGAAEKPEKRVVRAIRANASTLSVVDSARLSVVANLDRRRRKPRNDPGAPTPQPPEDGQPQPQPDPAPAPGPGVGPTAPSIGTCRPAQVVFYTARDWLRLGPKLAQNASPCAEYYISIPPLVADKTNPRPDQAWRIRKLGRGFHAMAEIHWSTWQTWVQNNGRTWYEAGVEARRRMAAAGYDVASGDTWAVNEFPSSVRRNLGTARADAREFVRGLYEGDGRPVKGLVFVIGTIHAATDASLYKTTMQGWLADSDFWVDMDRAVRFWAQEVYGDARRWGVAGAPLSLRRDYLNDFLQHGINLAGVAPEDLEPARAFLTRAYTPLGNAGWQWGSGLGWTLISGDQMQHFVSSQAYAMRHFAARQPGPDRFGFAWAPNNATAMPDAEFVAQGGAIADRLAMALGDSGRWYEADPGLFSCGPIGPNPWCAADVEGAAFTDAWRIFASWE
jgi:hypothetical protein